MKMYKFIILALVALLYSCGQNGGLPNSSGGTADDPTATSGSISFTSVDTNLIGLSESGQDENAVVVFTVLDDLGSSISGATVTFTLIGPNGGESINPASTTTSSSGVASTTLSSGAVPGPVSITASVTLSNGMTISATSSVISIGGGVPSASHFNLAGTPLNLYGLRMDGLTSSITAYVGDRYGNFNVLEGTSVSFVTEAGAINASGTVSSIGQTSVTIYTDGSYPEDVAINASENTDMGVIDTTYGTTFVNNSGPHPRDGWVRILAWVRGEESFEDANANGVYDLGEVFTDLGEPFIDKDDDGVRDSASPFEWFYDEDGDGYDSGNGVWDGPNCPASGCLTSKQIWTDLRLIFTGNANECYVAPVTTSSDEIGNGGSQIYKFMVADNNFNAPIPGTTVAVTHSGAGKLLGDTSYTIPDDLGVPYEISVEVVDNAPEDDLGAGLGKFYDVKFTVTSTDILTCSTITVSGTVR